MPADSEFLLPPNTTEAFESLCLDLFKSVFGDIGTQKYGRSGYAQDGVDIVSTSEGKMIGIQCKLRRLQHGSKLCPTELRAEVERALAFPLRLSKFILATSAQTSPELQQTAWELSSTNRARGLFEVELWCWDKIWHEIYTTPGLLSRILPVYWPNAAAALVPTSSERLHLKLSGTVWSYQWPGGSQRFVFGTDGLIHGAEAWKQCRWEVIGPKEAVFIWHSNSDRALLKFSDSYTSFESTGWDGKPSRGFPTGETLDEDGNYLRL